MNAIFEAPKPRNETVLEYGPASEERAKLLARVKKLKAEPIDAPLFIGDKEVRPKKSAPCRSPYDHALKLGVAREGGAAETGRAIEAALAARRDWAAMPLNARAAIFLKAADLLAGDWRWTLNAATMLCQSKSAHQAEIDAACEFIDFLRFNVHFAQRIYAEQPNSSPGMWNRLEQRPLEGFVYAVTPFNFTAIAGNLPTAPALMGNVVLWKPSRLTEYTAYWIMKLLREAGLPPGVINLVNGDPAEISKAALASRELAGIHYTGSTAVFRSIWASVGANIASYRQYPRLVGETGGKDFVLVHPSADPDAVAAALARGAFEYQGQKCSAASRAYVPRSLWPKIKDSLLDMVKSMQVGSPENFGNFVNAVIDERAFSKIKGYIDRAKTSSKAELLAGGKCDGREGWFIHPTVIQAKDPLYESMVEEIFGPVLTVFVYKDSEWKSTLELVDSSTPYALTGSIFARDRGAVVQAERALENAAGNFYINDKPTGAVVGQQPFGGARSSGTNDKAGSPLNLQRWTSPRTIKETFDPPRDYRYSFLGDKP